MASFSTILPTLNNQGFTEYSDEINDDLISFVFQGVYA